ncbi:MAG: (d)CMP kinase [Ilumatobacteraceae bacterium]
MRVVAIDGPAGAGKSTVAKLVAERLGLTYLDTGAMYRSVTYLALTRGVDPHDSAAVAELARAMVLVIDGPTVHVDGTDVTAAIRSPEVNANVSAVAANSAVRAELVARQRRWAQATGGGVMEGRDIATVVFPDAVLMVFLTASAEERARRRAAESGGEVAEIAESIRARDHADSTRADSPLVAADSAVVVMTDGKSVEQVVDEIAERFGEAVLVETGASGERGSR